MKFVANDGQTIELPVIQQLSIDGRNFFLVKSGAGCYVNGIVYSPYQLVPAYLAILPRDCPDVEFGDPVDKKESIDDNASSE